MQVKQLTFRVYPEYSGLFFLTKIFADHKAMIKYIQANVNQDMLKKIKFDKLRALCVHEEHFQNGKLQPQIGMVLFHMEDLNFEIVSHEYCHAATYYLEDMKADFKLIYADKDLNERMATIQGNLNGQFWNFYVDNDKILEK